MISAISGSSQVSLVGRPQADAVPERGQSTAAAPPPPPVPPPVPPRGTGASAQSLFEARVGKTAEFARNPPDAVFNTLFVKLDTDGDGKISPSEMEAAFSDEEEVSATTPPTTNPSLYESLFNAITGTGTAEARAEDEDRTPENLTASLEG